MSVCIDISLILVTHSYSADLWNYLFDISFNIQFVSCNSIDN